MIPRKLRLARKEFAIATTGRRAQSAHFSVTVRTTPENGGVAAVISKKVAKKAVDRHLLKRRVLAALKDAASPTCSIIVYARAGSPTLPYQALAKELRELLRAVG